MRWQAPVELIEQDRLLLFAVVPGTQVKHSTERDARITHVRICEGPGQEWPGLLDSVF
jgi:hypothetical protein